MKKILEDLTIRHPVMADSQTVLDLMVASDIAQLGESDSSKEDLEYDWTLIDLDQDAWLVFNSKEKCVGYAVVYEDQGSFSFDFYTHPTYAGEKLSGFLLETCEERAKAQLTDVPEDGSIAKTIITQVNEIDRVALINAGFKPKKYYFRMLINFEGEPDTVSWPEGSSLRIFVQGQDDQIVYDLIQAAFEKPGRVAPTLENWRDYMMREDQFDPDLWFLLFDQEKLIGVALCVNYPEFGWVRQLGVSNEYRSKGIGSALLQHAFQVFYKRGHKSVALGVDSERPQAQSLYENVGMQCVRRYDEYYKQLA